MNADGPATKRLVESETDADYVGRYRYLDHRGRRVPRWSARVVQVNAYYIDMGRELDSLESAMKALPGCIATRQVRNEGLLRPQVIGTFA